MAVDYGSLPFLEALEFFRRKINLPTQRWDDLVGAAHDRAFVVAGAMMADLLMDLRGAVDGAIAEGTTFRDFQKNFEKIVADRGWTDWTGEDTKGGRAWRARVIYDTNLFTAYAAGRYRQMKDVAEARPYWRYRHSPASVVPRAEHLAWDGVILRHDDPWWAAHNPPNGFGCKCYIETLAERDLKKQGLEPTNPERIPYPASGVDKGWDYQPGAGVDTALRQLVSDKLINYPPAISKALSYELNRSINAHDLAPDFVRRVLEDRKITEPLWLGFVENFEAIQQAIELETKGYLVLLPADAPRHVEKHHEWDGKDQRPATPEDYALAPEILADYDAIKIGDPSDKGLARFVVTKKIGDETFRAVFEVRPGKKNRAVALISLAIKK